MDILRQPWTVDLGRYLRVKFLIWDRVKEGGKEERGMRGKGMGETQPKKHYAKSTKKRKSSG